MPSDISHRKSRSTRSTSVRSKSVRSKSPSPQSESVQSKSPSDPSRWVFASMAAILGILVLYSRPYDASFPQEDLSLYPAELARLTQAVDDVDGKLRLLERSEKALTDQIRSYRDEERKAHRMLAVKSDLFGMDMEAMHEIDEKYKTLIHDKEKRKRLVVEKMNALRTQRRSLQEEIAILEERYGVHVVRTLA